MPLWNVKRDLVMTAIPGLLLGALMNIVVWRYPPSPPNVRPRKIIPGPTDIQANSGRSKRTLS